MEGFDNRSDFDFKNSSAYKWIKRNVHVDELDTIQQKNAP